MRRSRLSQIGRILSLVAMGVLLFSAVAAAQARIGKTLDEVKTLARKEPPVRLATTWEGEIIKFQKDGFKKKYGLSFEFTNVEGLASRERILNEALTGIVEFDVVNVSGALRDKFIKAGVIVPVDYASLFPHIRKAIISPKRHFLGTGMNQFGLAYNPKLVAEAEAPKGWEDCLKPKWKGRFAVLTRPLPFMQLHFYWGKEKSIAYHKALKANSPVWTSNTAGTLAQTAAGEYSMVCGIQYHAVKNVLRRDPSAPLKFVVPKEFPYQVGEALAVMKGARSPNAAVLLTAHFATDGAPGYDLFGRSNPLVEGTDAHRYVRAAGAKPIWMGWEYDGKVQAQASKEVISAWGFPKGRR